MNKATRILISTFGGFVGLMGVEHGIGEIMQGNKVPDGVMILSWPDSKFFEILAGEPAMTVIPNLFVTGVLAVLISLAFFVWSTLFVQRKQGGLVLILLSAPMLLFGGGLFPPILGVLLGVLATRINAPLTWCKANLSPGARHFLTIVWPWAFVACLVAWLSMFPGVAILSYFFGINNETLVFAVLACMFGFLSLAAASGLGRDVHTSS